MTRATSRTLVDVLAANAARSQPAAPCPARPAAGRAGVRILLVEDNEINQQIAVELLEGRARVEVAGNGRFGCSAAGAARPFDVVLMDLQMPELDGWGRRGIRARSRIRSLPIIAMTAHATVEERERCLAAGMQDHIAKPIDPAVLYAAVRRGEAPHEDVAALSPDATNGASVLPVVPGPGRVTASRRSLGWTRPTVCCGSAGNRPLYLKLLRQFVEQQADAPTRLSALLAAADRATAERLAHTIRGIAGNLGAGPVQAAAAELEQAIAASAPLAELEAAQRTLAERLTVLVSGLRQALGDQDGRARHRGGAARPGGGRRGD